MARRKPPESDREFTLVLTGINEVTTETENALFEAGCDDATITVRSGRVFLAFARAAASLKDAILSAIRDVRKAKIGAEVLRIDDCTLVTQAGVARKIDRSRQLVHQYVTGVRGPGGFPAPAGVTDGTPLWYWSEVAHWLRQNDMITDEVLREASEVAAINSALALEHHRRQNPALTAEILRSVADLRLPSSA
jgi:hypothetical protein